MARPRPVDDPWLLSVAVPRPRWPLALPLVAPVLPAVLLGPLPASPSWSDGLLLLLGVLAAVAGLGIGARIYGEPAPVALGRVAFFAIVGPIATALFTGTVLLPPAMLWTDAGLPPEGLQAWVTVTWFAFAGIGGARVLARMRRDMDRRYPLRRGDPREDAR